jgi:hypothetical protein
MRPHTVMPLGRLDSSWYTEQEKSQHSWAASATPCLDVWGGGNDASQKAGGRVRLTLELTGGSRSSARPQRTRSIMDASTYSRVDELRGAMLAVQRQILNLESRLSLCRRQRQTANAQPTGVESLRQRRLCSGTTAAHADLVVNLSASLSERSQGGESAFFSCGHSSVPTIAAHAHARPNAWCCLLAHCR